MRRALRWFDDVWGWHFPCLALWGAGLRLAGWWWIVYAVAAVVRLAAWWRLERRDSALQGTPRRDT